MCALLSLLLLVLIWGAIQSWSAGPERVTPENYFRIFKGMPRKDVESMLGAPIDVQEINHLLGNTIHIDTFGDPTEKLETLHDIWIGRRAGIVIKYGTKGEVIGKGLMERRSGWF